MRNYLLLFGLLWCQLGFSKIITLPIILSDEYNIPYVELSLNGTPQRFMLDTGSRVSLHISKEMMANIPTLELTGEKKQSSDFAGNIFENEQFIIKELSINGMMFKDIYGVELQPWGLELSIGEEKSSKKTVPQPEIPVIGLDFFHDRSITIDYANRALVVDDNQDDTLSSNPENMHELPFILSEEGILFAVTDQEKSYYLSLDTGASISMIKSEVLSQQTPTDSCEKISPDASSEDCRVIALQLSNLKLKEPIYALVVEGTLNYFENAGLLGTNFFEQFLVVIDLKNKKLMLKPTEQK